MIYFCRTVLHNRNEQYFSPVNLGIFLSRRQHVIYFIQPRNYEPANKLFWRSQQATLIKGLIILCSLLLRDYCFFKIIRKTQILLWRHWYPCFGLLLRDNCFLVYRRNTACYYCKCEVTTPLFIIGMHAEHRLNWKWDAYREPSAS